MKDIGIFKYFGKQTTAKEVISNISGVIMEPTSLNFFFSSIVIIIKVKFQAKKLNDSYKLLNGK